MITVLRILNKNRPHEGVYNIYLDVFGENVDILDACHKAVKEYIETEKGGDFFCETLWEFTWEDIEKIPDEICEHYGFRKVYTESVDVPANKNMIEGKFTVSEILWDTSEAEGDVKPEDIPDTVEIPFSELISEEDCDVDGRPLYEWHNIHDLKERIEDYMSYRYNNFTPISFKVDYR